MYGVVTGSDSVDQLTLSAECSSLYVNPVMVVHVTSILQLFVGGLPQLSAVAVTPVGADGAVHTCSTLLAGLCPIALTAYTLYDTCTLGMAALIPVCVAVSA